MMINKHKLPYRLLSKFLFVFLFITGIFARAQFACDGVNWCVDPENPTGECMPCAPPCPVPPCDSGGVGGTTIGAQTVPIDMYVWILAIVLITFAVLYAGKYRKTIKA
jgi:hypothetical protein